MCVLPGMPKLPRIARLLFFEISQKRTRVKFIFCMQISMQVFFKSIQWFLTGMDKHSQNFRNRKFATPLQYQYIYNTWPSNFPKWWYYHYWWAWSSILKLLKVTSLQYLYNISKKKLCMHYACTYVCYVCSLHYRFWWK